MDPGDVLVDILLHHLWICPYFHIINYLHTLITPPSTNVYHYSQYPSIPNTPHHHPFINGYSQIITPISLIQSHLLQYTQYNHIKATRTINKQLPSCLPINLSYTFYIIYIKMIKTRNTLTKSNLKIKKGHSIYESDSAVIYSSLQKLEEPSQGIIFFSQNYSTFCYPEEQEHFPNLQRIDIKLGQLSEKSLSQFEMDVKILVSIKPQIIQLFILDRLKGTILADEGQYFIPGGEDSTQKAKRMLTKKIWVRIDGNNNNIEVHVGDFIDPKEIEIKNKEKNLKASTPKYISCVLNSDRKSADSWKDSVNVYPVNRSQKSMPGMVKDWTKSVFYNSNDWVGNLNSMKKAFEDQVILRCNQIQITPLQRTFSPMLSTNSSILTKNPNIEDLDKNLIAFYAENKNFELANLPPTNSLSIQDLRTYSSWKNLGPAIDHSIKEDYGYREIERDGKLTKQPINILNHLIKLKTGTAYTKLDGKLSKKNRLKQITMNREFNLRFEVVGNEGVVPGAMSVLEIYPPFTCSPIHNHCETLGLMKTLRGSVIIEHYLDLNLLADTQAPYRTQKYQEGDYSWFSPHSYEIHRVINPTPTTSILLQSYANERGSREYFQFIQRTAEQDYYCEYSHQHDWRNYLKWQPDEVTEESKADLQFIESVKSFYKLEQNGILDDSFPRFVLVMKQDFEDMDA